MEKTDILFLSNDDLLNAGCFNMSRAIEVVKSVMIDYTNGQILYPDKISQIFDENSQNRINCLPATLLNKGVCGIKWVSVFPGNPLKGIPNVNATLLLSEIETGRPFVFMSGTLCSNMRTAAVSAIAAQYLANKDVKTIGFIGAGEQASMHFIGMKTIFPQIKKCQVAAQDRTGIFVQKLKALYNDVEFVSFDSDYEKAVFNADIVITAISGQEPILQYPWIKKGAFYCHVGGWEDDDSVALNADKIVCDDWNSVKHRTQTLSRLYKTGKLSDNDIYANLPELLTNKLGRERTDEFIYFNTVGLSYVDIALAYDFYLMAVKNNLGSYVSL